jgi:hypothetical protein
MSLLADFFRKVFVIDEETEQPEPPPAPHTIEQGVMEYFGLSKHDLEQMTGNND